MFAAGTALGAEPGVERLEPRNIRRIEIRNANGIFLLERSTAEGAWQITSPFNADADQRLAGNFAAYLAYLGGLTELEEKPTGEQLKAAGLQPPFAVVRLLDFEGRKREVGIGDPSKNAELTFIEQNGGIWLAPVSYRVYAGTPFSYFRDRRILRRDLREVIALSIVRNGESLSLKQEGDGWWLAGPKRAKARDRAVEELLKVLAGPVVVRYLDGEALKKAQGLEQSNLRVELDFRDGAKAGVVVGSRASGTEFYGRLVQDESIVTVVAAALPKLAAAPSDLAEAPMASSSLEAK